MHSKFTSDNIMNRIILLLFAFSLLAGCGQKSKNPVPEQDVQPITVSDFIRDAGPYAEQTVQISGTVVHVCRHGGQRLFIVGDDGDKRIRITTGEDIAEFDVELEGETIEVVGLVRELVIDETYLAQWETEVLEGNPQERGEGHEGGIAHGDSHTGDMSVPENADSSIRQELARIQEVREQIAESGKDHLSDYWIETIEYKVVED